VHLLVNEQHIAVS